MKRILITWLERLGGVRPFQLGSRRAWLALAVWWFVLFCAVYTTIGRGTKFIYVDF
jgi:hypothetical protein